MSPEYIEQLADMMDPDKLWQMPVITQQLLPEHQRKQLDAGVALRRHADDTRQLLRALADGRSILITPLSANGSARKTIATPPEHLKRKGLRDA